MQQLTSKPLSWFRVNPQVRKSFNEEELRQLGESMKTLGQLQPVIARPDGMVIAGERRYRAAPLAGLKELQVIISEKPLTETEIRLIQLTENMQRADLTGFEKWLACKELLELNPGWNQKGLAEHLHFSESMIVRLVSPSRCTLPWQEALRDGKVGISDCYAASKLAEADQAGLLALKLSGASRDAIEQAGRKSRTVNAPAVRLSRVKIAMPNGATIVVSGENLGVSEVAELLAEARKEALKAVDLYDVRTWQQMLADKRKRGG